MKKKILVIEDDKLLMRLLVEQLLKAGYEVVAAYDGQEGLEKVHSENPNLVLLDIVMPVMDGMTVLKKIKMEEKFGSLPMILLTNITSMDVVSKALEMGVNDYIVKGEYDTQQLIDKIKTIIG